MFKNKALFLLILFYSLAIFSVMSWGIPSETRPFTYHMDEWHQLSAVRALFTQGTPNVPGAAHGSVFQFFLSGIYLIPFTVLGIINPFIIHSLMDNLAMQEKIFLVLRSNTVVFGILSIVTLAIIAKKYFKSSPLIMSLLLIGTPIWLTLSSYFKYDIALIFWICLSVLFILHFAGKPTFKNYILAAIPSALALSTKFSALPIFAIYITGFFYFMPNWRKKYKDLIWGFIIFITIFAIFGIPDLFFRLNDYTEYLSSNLIASVGYDSNYLLGAGGKWPYILFTLLPMLFGHVYYVLFLIAFTYWSLKIGKWIFLKKHNEHKIESFIFFSFILFFISIIPLGLGASGNRSLVLLPFLALLTSRFLTDILSKLKPYFILFMAIIILIQIYESSVVIYAKYGKTVSQDSSEWIVKNISPGTVIGIENIPIYQYLPDVVLYEYYLNLTDKNAKTRYTYTVIDAKSSELPRVIIVTNKYLDEKYLIKSPKKELLRRLREEDYKIIGEFSPREQLYRLFYDDLGYYLSGINFVYPITIYEKG